LRILIVRSSPADYAPVPEAAPVRDAILALRPDLVSAEPDGPKLVQVDLLSSEDAPDVLAPPTKAKLYEQLESRHKRSENYDILLYLGHGDMYETQPGTVPIGQLILEDAEGYSDPIDAHTLSTELQAHPVPVVLLLGCLTAANVEAARWQALQEEVPTWYRGSQAVAQALVKGITGVQFVVGMRYRIENDDAVAFIEAFFKSLLSEEGADNEIGNLELAVRNARLRLSFQGQQAVGWAAPVIYRTPGTEPTFPFLATPPNYQVEALKLSFRAILWDSLASTNWSQRQGAGIGQYQERRQKLTEIEASIIQEVQPHAALLMPEYREADPAQLKAPPERLTIQAPVALHSDLQSIEMLEGILAEGSGLGEVLSLVPAPELIAAGFEFYPLRLADNRMKFLIRHPSHNGGTLAAGPLFLTTVALGPDSGIVYSLNITDLKSDPIRSLVTLNNAIVVPVP
ncbi:MAG: CHAT domain-containing protein, partial [Ardenticatenaceae bacterium]